LLNDANAAGKNLINSIKTLSEVKVVRRWNDTRLHPNSKPIRHGALKSSIEIIGIATSTGGPNALAKLLNQLPDDFQIPIVIVQHIMKGFAANFVTWLASVTGHHAKLAAQHELIQKNHVYIAPDDYHLTVNRFNRLVLSSDGPVKGHRPSADYLLFSIAKNYGKRGMGIILTGMGDDGAEGMKAIKDAGGLTIAQNKDSSVIFGMPSEAINLNAVDKVVSIDKIGETIFNLTK
jgi:two-component system chemotaxis response regulator CheB